MAALQEFSPEVVWGHLTDSHSLFGVFLFPCCACACVCVTSEGVFAPVPLLTHLQRILLDVCFPSTALLVTL